LALSREEVATARRLEGGRVEVVWDASLFPMVMVLERPGGQVLGFGQDGSLIVSTELSSLEVALSNGVRSSFRTVSVR